MQKNIVAFTIRNNHSDNVVVSNLVIGYSRVEAFYKEYSSLPESERMPWEYDLFMYEDLEKGLEDHLDSLSSECHANMEDDSFKGYWYTDKNGNAYHSWDFEESIGE